MKRWEETRSRRRARSARLGDSAVKREGGAGEFVPAQFEEGLRGELAVGEDEVVGGVAGGDEDGRLVELLGGVDGIGAGWDEVETGGPEGKRRSGLRGVGWEGRWGALWHW